MTIPIDLLGKATSEYILWNKYIYRFSYKQHFYYNNMQSPDYSVRY